MALFQLERTRQVLTVDMNDTQFCAFGTTVNAIGTRNLNGCHVVIIFSTRGAILAHIAPGPAKHQARDLESMRQHIIDNMGVVDAKYREKRDFFPSPGTETHTVHAWLGVELASPEQHRLIEQCVVSMGLPKPTAYRYDVNVQSNRNPDSSGGTVVLLGSSPPRLLIEDKIVSPKGQTIVSSAALGGEGNASSSNPATPAGVPSKHTGWVHLGGMFVAYREGVPVAQKNTFPVNVQVYSPQGWYGSAKNWARWDGDSSHPPVLW